MTEMEKVYQRYENKHLGELKVIVNEDVTLFCLNDVMRMFKVRNQGAMLRELSRRGIKIHQQNICIPIEVNGVEQIQKIPFSFVNETHLLHAISFSLSENREWLEELFLNWLFDVVRPKIRRLKEKHERTGYTYLQTETQIPVMAS